MTDLLHDIVGDRPLYLHVYDNNIPQPENLLYKNLDDSLPIIFSEQRTTTVNDSVWTLYFKQTTPLDFSKTWVVAVAGVAISLFFVCFLLFLFEVAKSESNTDYSTRASKTD